MKFVINIVTLALAGISSSVHARELGGGAVVSSESELNLSSCMSSTNSNTHPPFLSPSCGGPGWYCRQRSPSGLV